MDKFKEIREKIGKDLVIKIQKANEEGWGSITFNWEFNISIEWYIHKVADEFRTNNLSKTKSRYTIINFTKDQRGRIYPNIHDYNGYVRKYLANAYDFEFIYAWDDEDKKLIVVWEYDMANNQYRMSKQIAEMISSHMKEDISQNHNVTIV